MGKIWFCVAAASVLLLPVMAQAASLHGDEKGASLDLSFSCARQIEVTADSHLLGEVVMDATAANPEEIAQIDFASGEKVRLKSHGQCWDGTDPSHFQPTLDIKLRVAAAFALGVEAAGSTDYRVAVGGPLDFELSGSGQLDATKVSLLNLELSGSGAVRIEEVTGPISLDVSGSARVTIKQAQSEAVSAKISGSGHVRIENGNTGQLRVQDSGSGNVTLAGTVANAAVDLSGSGGVTIGKLIGKLVEDTSGSGTIKVLSH